MSQRAPQPLSGDLETHPHSPRHKSHLNEVCSSNKAPPAASRAIRYFNAEPAGLRNIIFKKQTRTGQERIPGTTHGFSPLGQTRTRLRENVLNDE